jgi:hypothetical protein
VAAELDKAAYEEGRPAIHKLQMLADVDRVSVFAFSSCAPSPCEWCAPAQQLLRLPCQYYAWRVARTIAAQLGPFLHTVCSNDAPQHHAALIKLQDMVQRDLHDEFLDGGVLGVFR